MDYASCIDQTGVVEGVGDDCLYVRLSKIPACGDCVAKSLCTAGRNEDILEIEDKSGSYSIGDRVIIRITKSLGYKALFIGYVLPFLLVLATLVISVSVGLNELLAGILSLLMLIPYFIVLYHLRTKLKRTFTFSLLKI